MTLFEPPIVFLERDRVDFLADMLAFGHVKESCMRNDPQQLDVKLYKL